MKKIVLCAAVFIVSLSPLGAFDVDGHFTCDFRLALDDGELFFNQEYGRLAFEHQVDDNLYGMASLSLRYLNSPVGMSTMNNLLSPTELSFVSAVGPLELALDEAYFIFMNFIFEGFDLTVGKQRINWGTADRLNPTDVLNPLDFSDPFDFGKKIPSLAVVLAYTFKNTDISIQLVFEPYSQVARLNPLMLAEIENGLLIPGLVTAVNSTAGTAVTPEWNVSNALVGAKFNLPVAGFDFSVNFVTRLADMPYVSAVAYTPPDVASYTFSYFREYEVGLDFSKEWGGLLTWAEAALFFQGEQTMVISGLGPDQYNTVLADDPYVKYTVGLSKKFGGGFYFNLQFNHGFFTERAEEGAQRCQDYLLLRLEWTVPGDKLTFGLTGLGNVNNLYNAFGYTDVFKNISENYGVMGGFDITYSPTLNLKVSIAVLGFKGTDSTTLGKMRDRDMVTFKFEYDF